MVQGSDLEEDLEEDPVSEIEVIPEDSFVDGRRQYATRRRVQLRESRATREVSDLLQTMKAKRSRIIRVQDSSEEDEDERKKRRKNDHGEHEPGSKRSADPEASVFWREQRNRQRFEDQAMVSDELDFKERPSTSLLKTQVRALKCLGRILLLLVNRGHHRINTHIVSIRTVC